MQKRITKRVRLAQKKRKKRVILILLTIALAIVGYAGIGFLLTQEGVIINKIVISGNSEVASGLLEATAMKGLATTRGLLLYGGTVFTYSREEIINNSLREYPRLKSAVVKVEKMNTLQMIVTEREAVAKWCALAATDTPEDCYLIDADGFIFAKSNADDLTQYTGDLAGTILRQTLLHGGFNNVHTFVSKLKDININPTTVHIVDGEIEVESTEHPLLKVKLDNKLNKTLSYIDATINSKEYKELSQSEDGVKYIDLRFGNRVYYK